MPNTTSIAVDLAGSKFEGVVVVDRGKVTVLALGLSKEMEISPPSSSDEIARDLLIEIVTMIQVKQRKITPRAAEEIWIENGISYPFWSPLRRCTDQKVWPLSLAGIWIAWREENRAAHEWARLQFWSACLYDEPISVGQTISLAEARFELGQALIAGELFASGIPEGQQKRVRIDEEEWPELTFSPDATSHVCRKGFLTPQFRDLLVKRSDLLSLWAENVPNLSKSRNPQQPSKRGPKPFLGLEVRAKMRAKLRDGVDLSLYTQDAMVAEFDASRETCQKARKDVLSEFVGNTPAKIPTIDK